MTALHSDLNPEVGPDHHFLVVPAIGEYMPLIAKGGLRARRGPAECLSLGLVAPATLIVGFHSFGPLSHSLWYPTVSFLGPVCSTNVWCSLRALSCCPESSLTFS